MQVIKNKFQPVAANIFNLFKGLDVLKLRFGCLLLCCGVGVCIMLWSQSILLSFDFACYGSFNGIIWERQDRTVSTMWWAKLLIVLLGIHVTNDTVFLTDVSSIVKLKRSKIMRWKERCCLYLPSGFWVVTERKTWKSEPRGHENLFKWKMRFVHNHMIPGAEGFNKNSKYHVSVKSQELLTVCAFWI